jgi:hypothetical protein
MHIGLSPLLASTRPFTLIVSDGFEDRTSAATRLLIKHGLRPDQLVLLRYTGDRTENSYTTMLPLCDQLISHKKRIEIDISDLSPLITFLVQSDPTNLLVCDVTGLSRVAIFSVLTILARTKREFWLLYTEAETYYPTRAHFDKLLKADRGVAFLHLVEYERTDIVYSGTCQVQDMPGFPGHHLPNYPLMVIAFLTFKRSRLGAVLREYESNVTVLIKAIPVRPDLKWRAEAMDIINFDLLEDHRNSIELIETLDWNATYAFLDRIYTRNHNRYRFNTLLAPLGSKMQTVGSWAFAFTTPEVRVVTSTPAELYRERYSSGWRNTFVIDDLPNLLRERGNVNAVV